MKKMIYHYCSLEVLTSIVENKKIWFSDLLESNDRCEDIYLFKLYFDYLHRKKINTQYVSSLVNEFNKGRSNTRIYGWCLSERKDELINWIGYARNNGVCIGFNEEKLVKHFEKSNVLNSNFLIKRVRYAQKGTLMNQYFAKICENENTCSNHFEVLIKDSAIYKYKGWKDEKEVRVFFRNYVDKGEFNKVLPSVQFLGKECKLNYCFKSGKPVFHYEVPLDLTLIEEIILGPNNEINVNGIISLLSRTNEALSLDSIKISKSRFAN